MYLRLIFIYKACPVSITYNKRKHNNSLYALKSVTNQMYITYALQCAEITQCIRAIPKTKNLSAYKLIMNYHPRIIA